MVSSVAQLEAILDTAANLVRAKVLPDLVPGMRTYFDRARLIAVSAGTFEEADDFAANIEARNAQDERDNLY